MGTFHDDKGELHGITVVVDTTGPHLWIGRCDTITEEGVLLLDADVHEEATDASTKQAFVEKAAKVGVWKKHDRVLVPAAEVRTVTPLGQFR